jgi:hypothetical protein
MLCSRQKPLNASATDVNLPNAHHERPSRAAGSFFGQLGTLRPTWRKAERGSGWASPCGVEGSVRNPNTPGGRYGRKAAPKALYARI